VLTRDFPELHPEKSRIIMLEAMDRVLAPFPEELQQYTVRKLEAMGVEVRLNTAVVGATPESVRLKDGSEIASHTLFWAAGVKAAPLADSLPVAKMRGGRVPVEADLSLQEHREVFIVGDMAYREQDGVPLPGVAQVAMQGGDHVARTIVAREAGKETAAFRYVDKGSMAVIGRHSAVANLFGAVKLRGFFAWLAWLGLHLFYLIGFRNRIVTLLNWAYEYFRYNRQVRLITSEPRFDDAPVVTEVAQPAKLEPTTAEVAVVQTGGGMSPLVHASAPLGERQTASFKEPVQVVPGRIPVA
jgi:NADH dehydrogenase